jgi:hypothetical protein
MKMARDFVGNKGNRRGEGNMGLVDNYEDGDGNGIGNDGCLRLKGVGQGGERGNGRMGLFLLIVFILQLSLQKLIEAEGRKEENVV